MKDNELFIQKQSLYKTQLFDKFITQEEYDFLMRELFAEYGMTYSGVSPFVVKSDETKSENETRKRIISVLQSCQDVFNIGDSVGIIADRLLEKGLFVYLPFIQKIDTSEFDNENNTFSDIIVSHWELVYQDKESGIITFDYCETESEAIEKLKTIK